MVIQLMVILLFTITTLIIIIMIKTIVKTQVMIFNLFKKEKVGNEKHVKPKMAQISMSKSAAFLDGDFKAV